jgi:hypothetical protein
MNVVFDALKIGNKKPVEGIDYVESEDTFVIFNVPILAEMVQEYDDGFALKSSEDILKVSVDGVPLTQVAHAPSHPPAHLSDLPTQRKKDYTVGYMSEISKPKLDASSKKRYADFVIYKTKKTRKIIDAYKDGVMIDTSIGFKFDPDFTPGDLAGQHYDYIQRNIRLDHNAILMSANGTIGCGRMPTPIGGIGADSDEIKQGENMADDAVSALKEQIDTLRSENDALKQKLDKKGFDELTKQRDEYKARNDELSKAMDSIKSDADKMKVRLDAFEQKEREAIDAMRAKLKEKYADLADVFDAADAELVKKKFDELQKKQAESKSKDIGADMMGPSGFAKSNEHERIEKVYNAAKKQ